MHHLDPSDCDLGMGAVARMTNVDPTTAFRWATRGVVSPNGVRVRLAAVRVGGRLKSNAAEVRAFVDVLNARVEAGSGATRTPAERAAAVEGARRLLRAHGVVLPPPS